MKPQLTQALSAAIATLLKPLVGLLLRNGVPFGQFAELAKRAYVDVAMGEFGIPGRKVSKSRASILTGLSRKEVLRVKRLPAADDQGAGQRYNRAARVVAGWVRDRRFADETGGPAALPFDGEGPTFSGVVRLYSGDAPARAVLDELLRVGAVERLVDGRIRLIGRTYIPRTAAIDKIAILGADVADLIAAIDHNIRSAEAPFFQRKVCYDNIPAEALAALRGRAGERAQTLLEDLDRLFSDNDRDVNPDVAGTGRKRALVGIYYFEDDAPVGPSQDAPPGSSKGASK